MAVIVVATEQQCLVFVNTDYGPVPAVNTFRVTTHSILPTALQAWTKVSQGRLPEAKCREVLTVGVVRREHSLKHGVLGAPCASPESGSCPRSVVGVENS